MEKLIKKLRSYAEAYREPPFGREIEGTPELFEQAAIELENVAELKKHDNIDFDSMIEILHNAPISFSYGYDCDIRVKEPSYIISQNDMIKLFNYVKSRTKE